MTPKTINVIIQQKKMNRKKIQMSSSRISVSFACVKCQIPRDCEIKSPFSDIKVIISISGWWIKFTSATEKQKRIQV